MRKPIIAAVAVSLAASAATAHEMFLKPTSFYVAPNASVPVDLVTGTFDESLNPVENSRMADVSVSTGGRVTRPAASLWTHDKTSSHLALKVGAAGTYAIGLSTRPNVISMSSADFDTYLRHDGIEDMIAARAGAGAGAGPATIRERYSKHVRAVVQVGTKLTDDAARPFGYPAEILLTTNPATLKAGDTLNFRVLHKGKPLANQLVYGSYQGYHGHDDGGGHMNKIKLRTAADGTGSVRIERAGKWYLTLNAMRKVNEPGVDYESNWATVTFEVR